MSVRRRQRGPEVFRITGARQGLAEDVRGRERRYVVSMLVRTAAVLLTVVLWDVQRPLAVAALVLGAALPYVAVVIANAGRENTPALPDSLVPAPPRQALGPAGRPADAGEREGGPKARTIRQDPLEQDEPEAGRGPDPRAEAGGEQDPGRQEYRRPEPGQEPSRSGPGRRD
ncbi:Protein of unknown function [Streptomyces pini]|uniref:DUF3099 domain-containing protein n=1 Tax=Streptomyces pini TaxID=1520580 RepID=A0A1I3VW75_9ACTN|nr:Protein of unknown function [Streptomyces pini]